MFKMICNLSHCEIQIKTSLLYVMSRIHPRYHAMTPSGAQKKTHTHTLLIYFLPSGDAIKGLNNTKLFFFPTHLKRLHIGYRPQILRSTETDKRRTDTFCFVGTKNKNRVTNFDLDFNSQASTHSLVLDLEYLIGCDSFN